MSGVPKDARCSSGAPVPFGEEVIREGNEGGDGRLPLSIERANSYSNYAVSLILFLKIRCYPS